MPEKNIPDCAANLGTPQEIIYPNCEVFCSASRRNDRRIVNYVTVIATQKLGKRTSKLVCSGVNQSVIFRRVFREGEAPAEPYPCRHFRFGRSLALPDKHCLPPIHVLDLNSE